MLLQRLLNTSGRFLTLCIPAISYIADKLAWRRRNRAIDNDADTEFFQDVPGEERKLLEKFAGDVDLGFPI